MTTCGTCHKTYSRATRTEHCMVCHQSFAGTEPGDAHRTGEHGVTKGPDRRRCRTFAEMIQGGMWFTTGPTGAIIWHGRIAKDGQARRNPYYRSAGAPQGAEQAQTGPWDWP